MKITPFKLEEFFAEYEFKVEYLLCSSDCESFSVQELLELADSYGEKIVMKVGKEYIFKHKSLYYYARG